MDRSDIHIDIVLRIESARMQTEIRQILEALSGLDGIRAMRLVDAPRNLLCISFDPYRLSARDILKWFAQQTIRADLLSANAGIPPADPPSNAAPLYPNKRP